MISFASPWKSYFTSLVLAGHRSKRAKVGVSPKSFQLHCFSATMLNEIATNFELADDVFKEWQSRLQVSGPYFLSAVWTRMI